MAQITTFDVDAAKRRLLTPQNLIELGITPDVVQSILGAKLNTLVRVVVDKKGVLVLDNWMPIQIWPDGLSINETVFGNYSGPTAAALGWMAYLEIGAPLVEERADIVKPPVDVLSTRAYENRANEGVDRQFSDTINFSIENTITWSLEGTSEFTFEGAISGELQAQLEKSLAMSLEQSLAKSLEKSQAQSLEKSQAHSGEASKTHTEILHNHKDGIGSESHDETKSGTTDATTGTETTTSTTTETTTTTTTTTDTETNTGIGSATGTGELSTQLMFGITGSVSGSLTTSWDSSSTVSGIIPPGCRVETMVTQRRQVKQYTYEFPITFGGFIALHYAHLVSPFGDVNNPQPITTPPTKVVAREINALGLVKTGKLYQAKGIAETVSTLDVEHIIFEFKPIIRDLTQTFGTVRPHNL